MAALNFLSLNDSELEAITAAAALLAPEKRDRFLKSVANIIGDSPPAPATIANAVKVALCAHGIAVGKTFDRPEPKRPTSPRAPYRAARG